MHDENELQQMAVGDLAQRCAQETQNYRRKQRHETVYCFELFRRAILRRDNEAWDALYTQYNPEVQGWVYSACRKHGFTGVGEEAQDFIMQSFEKFSKHFTEDKLTDSTSLAGVLSYLKACVQGVIVDCVRKIRYEEIELDETIEKRKDPNPEASPEEILQGKELWKLIQTRLKGEKEYIAVKASMMEGLKPRQILVEYPGVFRDSAELYQCIANVQARLRRDPEIRKFLNLDD
jgi:hypothetical protein